MIVKLRKEPKYFRAIKIIKEEIERYKNEYPTSQAIAGTSLVALERLLNKIERKK